MFCRGADEGAIAMAAWTGSVCTGTGLDPGGGGGGCGADMFDAEGAGAAGEGGGMRADAVPPRVPGPVASLKIGRLPL